FAAMMMGGCGKGPPPTATPSAPTSIPPTSKPTTPPPTPAATSVPQGKTILVTSAADSGPGSLRQALQDAQPFDTVTFDPTVFPPDAPTTIFVTGDVLSITQDHITIDASNAGVILDGSQLARDTWIAGLNIISDGNTVRGLQIYNFTGTGIVLDLDAQNNTIGGDRRIGVGPIGQGNLISSNDTGIALWNSASNNVVMGNLIGTDPGGSRPLGNHGWGIGAGTTNNAIGPDNIIAFNGECGINVDGVGNTLTQNSIFGNALGGICLLDGGNAYLQAPRILDVTSDFIDGVTCPYCTVEIFSDNEDEGAFFEGQVAADSNGNFTFNKRSTFIHTNITSTSTDLDGNTSEFSPPTSRTTRTTRILALQQENDLPRTLLQSKPSNELVDNRIGLSFYSPDVEPGPPSLDWDVEGILASGIKRIDTALTENEPPIDWSFSESEFPPEYDRFIDTLIENGIAINHMLHFWDKAGHPGGEGLDRPRFQNQEQIDDFLEYVRFVVSHFKGRADYYTIWSEPDYCGHDGLKCILPQDYIELARQVIPVIRDIDPQVKIVSAPYVLYFGRDDLFTLLRSDVVSMFDVISWHPVSDVLPNSEFFGNYYYDYPSIIREIQQTASELGFRGEYWGTEISWCAQDVPGSCPSTNYERQTAETTLQAAKYSARGIVMQLGMDVGVGLGGYLTGSPWVDPTIRNLNTVMAGNKPHKIPMEIESDATHLTSYGFSLPNGDRLFAVWNDNVAVDYDPGVPSTLTFPGMSAQKVIGIDVLHGFEQEMLIDNQDDNLLINNLLVKDYPILLRLIP
ncbi:MAG TPA: hypothetical protein VIS72_01300, partial [Anaerolineales bacterium]